MTGSSHSPAGVRTQAFLMIVVVFLVGAFAGGAFERMSHRGPRAGLGGGGRMWGGGRGGGRGGPDGMSGGMSGGMSSSRSDSTHLPPGYGQIGLSENQRARLDSAFARRRPRVDSLMKATWAIVRPAMDSTRTEVNAILTNDQRDKLDSLRRASRGTRGSRGRGANGRANGGGRDTLPPHTR